MLAKFRARSDPVPAPRFCERSFAREADRLAACAQTQNQITTMPSELSGVTTIDIGNKNVATGKNDIESTSTGLKKKVTLGLLLVLLIAAVGSTAAAFVVILGKDNQSSVLSGDSSSGDDSSGDDDDSASPTEVLCATPGNRPAQDGWVESAAGAADLFADGDPTLNAGGSQGIVAPAWGLWAASGGDVSATFSLTGGALASGQSVEIDFDNGFVESGGRVGVAFLSGGVTGLEFYFEGGTTNYQSADSTGSADLGLPFTGDGMTVGFDQNGPGNYDLRIGLMSAYSGVLSNGLQGVDQVRVFASSAGPGPSDHDVYFNCLRVFR